jgi:hypothetical protein
MASRNGNNRKVNGNSGDNSTADLESQLDIVKNDISNIEPAINVNQNAIGAVNTNIATNTSNITTNTTDVAIHTTSIAELNDYWQWDSMQTDTDFLLRGPNGVILVQSNKYRLWHTGSDIWKKNNTGSDVVLPNGFYKCVVTTLPNHAGHQWSTDLSFGIFRGIFDYVTTSIDATNDDQPCYTADVTQTYHKNSIGSSGVDNTGRAEIVFRPNNDVFGFGENNDAIKKLETYIRWKDAPATTTTDKVRLRFRMFPIVLGE